MPSAITRADPERENSGKHWTLWRQNHWLQPSSFALFSLWHGFLTFTCFPSNLCLLFHQIFYFSLFQIPYFALHSFTPFYLLLTIFDLNFTFLSLCLVSVLLSYYGSPFQSLKMIFFVISHLTFFFPVLKYPYSPSTFISLCSLVVNMVVIASFLLFYSYIFTIFVFQITNFNIPLSYSILPSFCPFFSFYL